jgi:hypothetical protein
MSLLCGGTSGPYLLPVARGSGLTARGVGPAGVREREPMIGRGAGPISVECPRLGTPQAKQQGWYR